MNRRAPQRGAVLALALLGAALPGCARSPHLAIEGPVARASPALVGVVSIFLRVANSGSGGDALLRASVDVPGAVAEIHDVREGRMVRSDRLPIPARGSLELRPGGPHIMVFQMPEGAAAGRELTVRLTFETSGERLTSVTIER